MLKVSQVIIPHNFVLIKPDMDFKTYQVKGEETNLAVTTESISSAEHFSVRGKIYRVPERLIFNGSKLRYFRQNQANDHSGLQMINALKSESVAYDVPIEVEVGDIGYFQYTEHYDCNKTGRAIETDEGEMLLMRYDSLIFSHADDDTSTVKALNGHLIISPIKKPVIVDDGIEMIIDDNGLFKPVMNESDRMFKSKKFQLGIIKYAGCVCESYIDFPDRGADSVIPKVGSVVLYIPSYARSLEYEFHRTIFGENKLFRLHRKDILTIFEFENLEEQKLMLSKITEWLTLQ